MTRIAIITDVHGDVETLRAALPLMRQRADRIVCAGDLVDYGRYPNETIALLAEEGIPCCRGNHDRWALRAATDGKPGLTDASLVFLSRAKPAPLVSYVDGTRIAIVHGRKESDMQGMYPDTPEDELRRQLDVCDADILICGHTHVAMRRRISDGRVVVNPGALIRDVAAYDPMGEQFRHHGSDMTLGSFGILDVESRRFWIHDVLTGEALEL